MGGAVSSTGFSRTAMYVAVSRALGAREADPAARNPDHMAERLVGDPRTIDLEHSVVDALRDNTPESSWTYDVASAVRMMTVRTRFIDEALERAIRDGASQVVVLGAGFDSHAYRCRDLLDGISIFELDRPSTQALKMARVNEALGGPPENLTYVALDFEHDDLSTVLSRYGAAPSKQTFFILEGVTMYLPEDSLRRTLRFVATHAPGSAVVFDFVSSAMIDMIRQIDLTQVPAAARPLVQRFLDLTRNEPWVFGFPFGREREFLAELGLDLGPTLRIGGEEADRRYLTRTDGTQIGAQAIADAMAAMAAQSPPADAETLARMSEQRRSMAHQLGIAVVR